MKQFAIHIYHCIYSVFDNTFGYIAQPYEYICSTVQLQIFYCVLRAFFYYVLWVVHPILVYTRCHDTLGNFSKFSTNVHLTQFGGQVHCDLMAP